MRHGTGSAPAACNVRSTEPVAVVVLLAPDRHGAFDVLFDVITEVKRRDHTAVLVVFNRAVDADIVRRATDAGADLCVVEPSVTDLFSHIERARSAYRSSATPGRCLRST